MLHRMNGIVIRTLDYGEGNKIITLYTEMMGKISVMARGAKKVKSRLSAVTQLFTYGDYTFFKSSGMGTLNTGEIIHGYHKIHEDIYQTAYASYIVELVDRIVSDEDEGSSGLFRELKAALDAIESGKDGAVIIHIFELKMLYIAGYSPVLHQCVSCGTEQDRYAGFDLSSGGMLCLPCGRTNESASLVSITEKTLKLVRLLQQTSLTRLGKVQVSKQTKAELNRFMRALMDEYVSVPLKSRNFLDQMRRWFEK